MGRVASRPILVVAGALLLLLGLYAAAGYLLAPRLIRDQAQDWTRSKLGQELALGEIKVDPFAFRVEVADIALPARDPMVSARKLELDFAARSLFSDSYRFDRVVLTRPEVKAIVLADGTLNLAKLVPPPNPDPVPPVLVAELDVNDGAALVADHSRPGRPEKRLAPIRFHLENFHTTRDEGGGFRLAGQSDRGEAFKFHGAVSMAPIASHGGLVIRNLQAASIQAFAGELLPLVLREGGLDLDIAYTASYGQAGTALAAELPLVRLTGLKLAPSPGQVAADLSAASLVLKAVRLDVALPPGGAMKSSASVGGVEARDLALLGTGAAKGEAVRLASAAVERIGMAPGADGAALAIGALRLAGLELATTRAKDGRIGLMKLVPPARGKTAAPAALPVIGEISLSDARLRLTDLAVRPVATWVVAPLTVTARSAAGGGRGPLKVSIAGTLNGRSPFSAAGDLDPTTPSADLAVRLAGFPLVAAVPYTIDFPALELRSGTASAQGRLVVSPTRASYSGSAGIDNLGLIETYRLTDLVAWKRLALDGIEATPKALVVGHARLSAPYGEVVILEDGTTNFQRLVTFNPTPVVTPSADAAPPPKLSRAQRRAEAKRVAAEKEVTRAKAMAALAAPLQQPDFPVLVKRLDIEGGELDFADYSLRPNFAAKVQGLGGQVRDISNRPDGVAKLKLAGYVIDKYSPVSIAGEINPLQYDRRTQVDMAFRNIELPVFNPYSGRYAGYAIAKGKLTTEIGYTIDNRALDAKHHIVIDQLEWGEATDSKEKVSLPIKFATSLLKDKNGVIDLDVPVKGTLDDPDFSIGPIVWKIIGNLITKVITSPFRALGDLFGGKEDVQFVDFAPGTATVPADAVSNLAGIAKGLGEKPELRLDIPSGPAPALDATALADSKIAAAAMAKEAKKGRPADLAALDPGKRRDRLKDLYKATFRKSPEWPEKPAAKEDGDTRDAREADWLLAELRPAFQPTPAELAALGRARAEAVRLALLEGGTPVDAARLFLSDRDSATEKDGKARMELKLE